jgi:hypothetical protein
VHARTIARRFIRTSRQRWRQRSVDLQSGLAGSATIRRETPILQGCWQRMATPQIRGIELWHSLFEARRQLTSLG